MGAKPRVLVLWNQVGEDIYERWRAEGPRPLAWAPQRMAPDVGTVQEEIDALAEAIRQSGHEAVAVNVEDDLGKLWSALQVHRPDAVFNLVEFFNDDQSQEALVAGLFELAGVPYTGCPPLCLATCQRKYRTKVLLEAEGLPTPPYFLVTDAPVPADHGLPYPLIVKPAREDASGGIEPEAVVTDQAGLEARVRYVLSEFAQPALVEQYIDGREIHAALLGNDPPEVLPLFEMVFDASLDPRIISYRAKWDPHSRAYHAMDFVVPPNELPEAVAERIRAVARRAYQVIGCRDYARIDLRIDARHRPHILEVNPNPDLAEGTGFMACAAASGAASPPPSASSSRWRWRAVPPPPRHRRRRIGFVLDSRPPPPIMALLVS